MLSGDLPTFHSSPETGQEVANPGRTAWALPGCLGKLSSLGWQLRETEPVRRLRVRTPPPLLLRLEKTQREAKETLSPKPNSSGSLLGKLLLRLPGSHSLPLHVPPHPNLEPQGHFWLFYPTTPFLSLYVSLLPFHPEMQKPPQRPSGHQHTPLVAALITGKPRVCPTPRSAPLLPSLKCSPLCPATPVPTPAPP